MTDEAQDATNHSTAILNGVRAYCIHAGIGPELIVPAWVAALEAYSEGSRKRIIACANPSARDALSRLFAAADDLSGLADEEYVRLS